MNSDFTIKYPYGCYVKPIKCFDSLWDDFQNFLSWEDYQSKRLKEIKDTPLHWINLTDAQERKIRNLLFDEYIEIFENWVKATIPTRKPSIENFYSITITKK